MATTAVSHVRLPDEAGAAAAIAAQSLPAGSLLGAEAGGVRMHHDDVLGEEVPPELELSVRGIIMQLVARDRGVEPTAGQAMGEFPGAQPVSLMRDDVRRSLCDPAQDYRVSWKADGTRYLLLLLHGGAYLLNRAARVRRVQLRFPGAECEGGKAHKPLRTLDYTLLDGEMVVDTLPGEPGRQVRRFLAYDLCSYRRDSPDPGTGQLTQLLCGCAWRERVAVLADKVVRPKRLYEEASGPGRYRADAEPFRVRVKDFYPLERAGWVLSKWMPTLTHQSDGLVFQSGSAPYVGHTDERLFKWKFPEMNTVDFLVLRDPNDAAGRTLLCVADSSGGIKDLAYVALPPDVATDARGVCPTTATFRTDEGEPGEVLYEERVAEFRWDAQTGKWSFLRERRDKHHPNHESVFIKVWRSIRDGITAPELLAMLPRPPGEPERDAPV
jgi:mRNA-capping enzyme